MTDVITQTCCNDASCVAVCPVDCIHPTPREGSFKVTEIMLYIDPATCIDCGACADACPVDAIRMDIELDHKTAATSTSMPPATGATRCHLAAGGGPGRARPRCRGRGSPACAWPSSARGRRPSTAE